MQSFTIFKRLLFWERGTPSFFLVCAYKKSRVFFCLLAQWKSTHADVVSEAIQMQHKMIHWKEVEIQQQFVKFTSDLWSLWIPTSLNPRSLSLEDFDLFQQLPPTRSWLQSFVSSGRFPEERRIFYIFAFLSQIMHPFSKFHFPKKLKAVKSFSTLLTVCLFL